MSKLANGTEIATAYVQIIPSARGIKGKIKEALGSEAESAGNSSGKRFGSSMVRTITRLAAAAGIGKAIGDSITEGGALQQSLGGIETLFQDSADTVKAYAANAYASAGLSANEYMETVTSFSAALINSMGNDTAAAAEKANMALTDMSDNANKMGTNMQDIQNAYQGFAKQNYTMLDNLKLGYGGTKEEMERLLEDAQKISGITYDVSSYADVVDAIHVIQTQMGITGTTAEEAATTFNGSLASMKAAAKNLAGSLSLGFDIGPALQALGDTAHTFLVGNLLPMVGNVLGQLPQLVSGALHGAVAALDIASQNAGEIVRIGADLVRELGDAIITALPQLATSAIHLVTSFGTELLKTDWIGIGQNLISKLRDAVDAASREIFGGDKSIVEAVGTAITNSLPGLLDKGVEIVTRIANGILEQIPVLVDTAAGLVAQFGGFVADHAPVLLAAGAELAENLLRALADNVPAILQEVGTAITETFGGFTPVIAAAVAMVGTFKTGLAIQSAVQGASKALSGLKAAITAANAALAANPILLVVSLVAGLVAELVTLWNTNEGFRNAVTSAWEAIKTAFGTAIDAISGFFSNLAETAAAVWEHITATVSTVIDAIGGFFSALAEKVSAIWDGIKTAASTVWDTIKNVVQVALMFIVEVITGYISLITAPFRFIWESCRDIILGAWEAIKSAVTTALEAVSSAISTVWNTISGFFSTILETIKTTVSNAWNAISTKVSSVLGAISSTVSSIWSAIVRAISTAVEAIKTTVTNVFHAVKNTVSTVFNAVKSTVTTIWNGIKTAITTVINAIKTAVTKVFNTVKTAITDPLNAAKTTVSNIFSSIKTAISDKINAAKDVVKSVIDKIKGFFNFSWSLPKLKLPHISISGSFSLMPPSVPKFSISWYKKAMGNAMVLDGATIFGAAGGKLLGGGEAGREVIAGESHLLELMRNTVGGELQEGIGTLEAKLDRLIELLAALTGVTININGTDYRSKMELAETVMELLERERIRREATI